MSVGRTVADVDAESPIVLLLHGPNLNLLGEREPEVYGTATLADYVATAERRPPTHGLADRGVPENHEGELVDAIHGARGRCAAIIINPGAFTHYAWSIHDALAAFDGPIVELHLSNPNAREPWRHTSVSRRWRRARSSGFGGARLRARRRGRRRSSSGAARDRRPRRRSATRHGPTPCGPALDGATLLVSTSSNIRWLTAFTGSLGWVVVGPTSAVRSSPTAATASRPPPTSRPPGSPTRSMSSSGRRGRRSATHVVAACAGDGAGRAPRPTTSPTRRGSTSPATLDARARRRHDRRRCAGSRTPASSPAWPRAACDRRRRPRRRSRRCSPSVRPRPSPRRARAPHAPRSAPTARATTRSSPAGPTTRPARTTSTGRRTIVEGDTVIIDVGALVDGYHSDMTRTFVVGEPTPRAGARSTTSCSRPSSPGSPRSRAGVAGARASTPPAATCSPTAGYGDWYIHGTGHGVGLLTSTRTRSSVARRRPPNCRWGTW